jgi:hypothetical protein
VIGRIERTLLLVSVLVVGGTGLTFAWMKYLMKGSDPFSVVNHPWQPYLLSGHVLAAPALVFALGLIAREHILGKYRDPKARRGRRTGMVAAWILIPMAVSGYALQVLVTQDFRRWAAWGHLAAGVFFLILYAAHALLARGGKPRESAARLGSRSRAAAGGD